MFQSPRKQLALEMFLGVLVVVVLPSLVLFIFEPAYRYSIEAPLDRGLHDKTNELYVSGLLCESDCLFQELKGQQYLSVVIPAYNEEKRLPIMLDSTLAYLRPWSARNGNAFFEIIVVDDSSSDSTMQVALQYATDETKCSNEQGQHQGVVRVVKLGKNRGKGGAVKRGVRYARGKYVLMADADGATEIADLDKLLQSLQKIETKKDNLGGVVGLAVGSRAHLEEKSIASRAFYRTVLMRGFHLLVMTLCTQNIRDTQCGFKLFTHHAAKLLFANLHLERWAFDIEIIFVAEALGVPIAEEAVTWREIPGSKLIQSKLDVVTTSITMARDMLCVRLSYLLGIWRMLTVA